MLIQKMQNQNIFIALATLFVTLGFVFKGSDVHAHSDVEEAIPNFNEIVEYSPDEIEIFFADPVSVYSESVKIINSDGQVIQKGKPNVDPSNKRHVVFPIDHPLPAGRYTVDILAVAMDGHEIKEQYQFQVIQKRLADSEFWSNFKLTESSPSDGEILSISPTKITFMFSDIVELDVVGLYDDQQKMIPLGKSYPDPTNPRKYIIELKNELEEGTYEVNWYVQKDNKSKNGIFYFAVGEVTSITPAEGQIKRLEWIKEFDFVEIASWLSYFGVFILFGGVFFQIFISKGSEYTGRWNKVKSIAYLVSIAGFIVLFTARMYDLNNISFIEFLSFQFVWGMLLQLLLVVIALFHRTKRTVEFILLIATILIWAFSGHAVSERYGGILSIGLDAIHLFSIAIWMGGLFALLVMLPKNDSKQWFKEKGKLFSKYALVSIVIMFVTGVGMLLKYIPSFTLESLLISYWGNFLFIKVILFVGILGLGLAQMIYIRRNVKIRKFLSLGTTEFVIGLLIIFFATSLVNATPRAAEQGIYPKGNEQDSNLSVMITPLKLGYNDLMMTFDDEKEVKDVNVKLSMPPFFNRTIAAFPMGNGVYMVTGGILHGSGTIDLEIYITNTNGTEEVIPYEIQVPGEMYER
ncbi:copper resistance CopC/CopD family protein [Alkalihalobacillus deserti]|uniref:copper resistance CopC/CopD family protein n=1 Tax=Alkalihalobacillus deserti TaxID=2879466 RepID=UPI001D14988C|nr:copper resistance protein CopC [Alkalihalobacillus deserti]